MRPRRRRIVRIVRIVVWLAAGIGALVLLVAIALAFLVGTQTGTRFLFARLGALLPGTFHVQSAAGRIDSPLTLRGVVYKRPGTEIRIDRLYLEWRLGELLARRVDVTRLYADGVHIVSTPTPNQQPTKLPDLDLHFNIIVRDARVRGLTVGGGGLAAVAATGPAAPVAGATAAAGAAAATAAAASGAATPTTSTAAAAPTVIDEIDLATTDIGNVVHLDRLAVRSAVLRADVTGTVQPRGDYPVDLAMRWEMHPPGPPATAAVVGNGTLKGSLATLRVDQTLTAPFDVRVAAVLFQPLRDLRFDGRVAWNGVNPHRLRADLPDLQLAWCCDHARGLRHERPAARRTGVPWAALRSPTASLQTDCTRASGVCGARSVTAASIACDSGRGAARLTPPWRPGGRPRWRSPGGRRRRPRPSGRGRGRWW